jgi:hypothetical protein
VTSGATRSAKRCRRSGSRENTRTSRRSRTAASAHNWVYAWVPEPMTATTPASPAASASAATAPMAPVRLGPSSFPMATARTRPVVSSWTTTTWAPGSDGNVS